MCFITRNDTYFFTYNSVCNFINFFHFIWKYSPGFVICALIHLKQHQHIKQADMITLAKILLTLLFTLIFIFI